MRPEPLTRRRARGFTLLELLLAVLAFGLLASTAYGVLSGLSRAAAAQDERGERLRAAQLAVLRLERELRQALPVTGGGFVGDARGLAFVTPAAPAPGVPTRLQRVEYGLDGTRLWRLAAPRVPGPVAPARAPSPALAGVERLSLAFLDAAGEWRDTWRAEGAEPLPRAVRLVFEAEGLGRIERWIELAGDRP